MSDSKLSPLEDFAKEVAFHKKRLDKLTEKLKILGEQVKYAEQEFKRWDDAYKKQYLEEKMKDV